jgi:hypothetical protein
MVLIELRTGVSRGAMPSSSTLNLIPTLQINMMWTSMFRRNIMSPSSGFKWIPTFLWNTNRGTIFRVEVDTDVCEVYNACIFRIEVNTDVSEANADSIVMI